MDGWSRGSIPVMDLVRLRKTKVKVLEIVWAYLYSGREQEAWTELADSWPPADQARVKAAILAARSRGIESQVAVIAKASSRGMLKKRPKIYETTKTSGPSHPPNIIAIQALGGGFRSQAAAEVLMNKRCRQ